MDPAQYILNLATAVPSANVSNATDDEENQNANQATSSNHLSIDDDAVFTNHDDEFGGASGIDMDEIVTLTEFLEDEKEIDLN